MIKFIGKLPKKCTIAFSGGVDSVTVTDFLLNGKRQVDLAFFNHGTKTSNEAEIFVKKFADERGLKLTIGRIDPAISSNGLSQEEYWRIQRYSYFSSLGGGSLITCHHLDDAVETWIFTSLHGQGRIIPYSRSNIIRPFLVTPKDELLTWAKRRNLEWIEDLSNRESRYARNRIRHAIVPEALKINPGLRKMIRKKYLSDHSTLGLVQIQDGGQI